jgi:hypothetical protein
MKRSYSFQPQLKVVATNTTGEQLYVRRVSLNELLKRWVPLNPGKTLVDDTYYIECTSQGDTIWKDAKIYTSLQLVPRDNVHVISYQDKEATA